MKASTVYVNDIDTASAVTYYTVPANTRAKVVFLHVEHNNGSGSQDVEVYVSNGTDHHIMHAKSLAVGGDVTLGVSQTSYIMLESGYEIKAQASGAGCQLILTVEETPFLVSTA